MSKNLPDLSPSEWAVMKAIWRRREATVRNVAEDVHSEHKWAYNTVKTFMERLAAKGYLSVRKIGNTCLYKPAITRPAATRRALGVILDRVLDGTVGPLVTYLAERGDLTDQDLEQLRSMIDQAESDRKDSKGPHHE